MEIIDSIDDIIYLAMSGFQDWLKFGHVTVRKKENLLIFNYNTMAQFNEQWNFFERVSRGLIINYETGEIVARAFDKFFNWAQGNRKTNAPIVRVMEKMDGSLGVLYRHHSRFHIATRGSFGGEQALWASDFLQANYDLTGCPDEYTLLFEIIYPDNRIVVDYGKREDLVLLAIRNRFTGEYIPYKTVPDIASQYGFSLPKVYPVTSIETLIADIHQMDANDEGFVVEFADGERFKFKSLEYLKLHKLIHSLTFKNVVKAMQNNEIENILHRVPDEFLDETRAWIAEIEATIEQITNEVQLCFDQAPKGSRKEFASWVNQNYRDIGTYLFAMLDERDITPLIYQRHNWEGAS